MVPCEQDTQMHKFLTDRFCAPERSLSFIMFSRGASDIQYQ